MERYERVLEELYQYLPCEVYELLCVQQKELFEGMSELRMSTGTRLRASVRGENVVLTGKDGQPLLCTERLCAQFFALVTEYSPYAYESQLRDGFITLKGGHRVGIAGVSIRNGAVRLDADAAGFVLRICGEVKGCAQWLMKYVDGGNEIKSTLLFSPPGYGKTTVLRDAARLLAQRGKRVCIVDEREEISARGALDTGEGTMVISAQEKELGMQRALRTLAPQVIICDEIGTMGELIRVGEAARCGVAVISSAHASGIEELKAREGFSSLLEGRQFRVCARLADPWRNMGHQVWEDGVCVS